MKKKIYLAIIITTVAAFLSFLLAILPIFFFEFEIKTKILFLVIALVLLTAVSVILASVFSKKIMKPIDRLNPDNPKIDKSYDEIDQLIHKLRRQNDLIDRQMGDLRRRQVEFNAITENMSEGLIILDNKSEILFYNSAAANILGAENVTEGEHFISLCRSRRFVSAVSQALEGEHGEASLNIGQKVYQILANPVIVEEELNGAIIVILDITEKEKREEMRREFSSNVSHELKTPLTTISGISELFINSMIAPADIPRFAKNIYDEAHRLLELINDIIKLSRLEEGDESVDPEEIRLDLVAEEIKNRLLLPAEEQNLTIETDFRPVLVMGNPRILNEMIYNLVDNAIKYNNEGGRVKISVFEENRVPTIIVADTGIGIPREHQDRIFERFYRVDKSHSKEVGGTGLGLSIVKHSAEQLGAHIALESAPEVGTTITITFPPCDLTKV